MTESEAYSAGFKAGRAMYKDPHGLCGNYRCPWGNAKEALRLSWQQGCRDAMAIELIAFAAEEARP